MACSITDTLKKLRDSGATPTQIKEAKKLLTAVKSDKEAGSTPVENYDSESAYRNLIKQKEEKIIKQMGGTIDVNGKRYDIVSLKINESSVTVQMERGKSFKTYSFAFGRGKSLPTTTGKIVEATYLHLYTEVLKKDIAPVNNLSEPQTIAAKYTEKRTADETSSVMGSHDIDQEILDNVANGTYKKIDGMSATLGLINDNIQTIYEHELTDAVNRGINIDLSHYEYAVGFIESVKNALGQVGIDEMSHKFEMYETQNEHTVAYWKDGDGLKNGTVDGGKIVVLKGKPDSNGRVSMISNNAELMLHEFSHSVTENAMRQDRVLSRKIEQIQKEVMKQLTAANLLSHIADPTVAERARAQELIRYMNGHPSEFLAYAISNQQVYLAMKDMHIQIDTFSTSQDKNANAFVKTLDTIKGIINKVLSLINNGPTAGLAFNNAIQEVIARNMQIKSKMYIGETFDDYADKVTGGRFEKVDNFMKEGTSRIESKLEGLKLLSPSTKDGIQNFINTVGEIKFIQDVKESGVMQNIMHTMFRQTTDEEFAASFQLIRKTKTDNDKHQNSLKEINLNLVHSWFKDVPEDQRMAVTDLLSADITPLGLTKSDLAKLLSNPEQLDASIAELIEAIGEDEYLHQAQDLGWYMMHGTSKNPLLQTNAYRIYHRMYNGSKKTGLGSNDPDEMIANIDKLASMYALKFIDSKSKSALVTLLNNKDAVAKSNDITDQDNYHVVDLALHLYEKSKKNEMADFGDAYSKLMDKGYLRKAHSLPMKTRIVPEHLMRELIDRGYSKESTYSQAATNMRNDGHRYHIMYAPDYSVSRTQGAIHDIGYFDKVQQMSDIYDGHNVVYEKNSQLVEEKLLANSMYNGLKKPFRNKSISEMDAAEDQLMAVVKLDGSIVDFSVPIGRSIGQNHMMEDRDIASTLAATVTHRSAKGKAIRGNIGLVNHLLAVEFQHSGDEDYVVLRRSTKEEIAAGKPYKYDKQYAMIPEYTRDYIRGRRGSLGMRGDPNSIRIHKDMINDFIGYKDVSVADFKLGRDGKYFDMSNHPIVALRAEQIQYWIKKMIARYKTVLVILNPQVIVGNAISNFNMATVHGIDPITYTKLFVKHWKHLDDYSEMHKDLLRFESERDAGMKGLDKKIESLNIQLAANPMHDLMEDGQFNMIIEDIDTYNNKEDHVAYQKRRLLEGAIGKEGAAKAKEAIDSIILTKESSSFRGIEKLTMYNDIINRAIVKDKLMYEHAVKMNDLFPGDDESQREAKEKYDEEGKRDVLNYVDQLFVNYSYLDNRYIKYANDMGLILFTKYLFRALKTLKQVYDRKPLSMAIFLGLESTELMPSMFDENPYSNYAHPIDSTYNRLGPIAGHNFGQMAEKLLTPASIGLF